MGKLTSNDLESLQKAGIVNTSTAKKIKEKGLASHKKHVAKRYIKTKDGKWVSPMLYFRGNTDTEPSNAMNEFRNKFNELVQEYTTHKKEK